MKKLVIIAIFLVIIIGIILAFFLIDKQEEFVYKGVWMPSFGTSSLIAEEDLPENLIPEGYSTSILEPIFADLDKAEAAGINIFSFSLTYWVNESGEMSLPPGTKEFFGDFIEGAHARKFKIWLCPEVVHKMERGNPSEMRRIPDEWIENTNFIENFKDAIVETAEFAEEHDVEIFSPSGEMFGNIGREKSKQVIVDVKSRVDEAYSGKICLRGEWALPEFVPYYSCFGRGIGAPRSEQEKQELINQLDQEINKGVEIIIGEIYEGADWQGTQEELKRNYEWALEAAKGRANGVLILDSGHTYRQIFPQDFETVVKEYYFRY